MMKKENRKIGILGAQPEESTQRLLNAEFEVSASLAHPIRIVVGDDLSRNDIRQVFELAPLVYKLNEPIEFIPEKEKPWKPKKFRKKLK